MSLSHRAIGLILLPAGFVVWSLAFIALYGLLSVGCELGWQGRHVGPLSMLRVLLLGLWAAHLAALAWLVRLCWRRVRAQEGDGRGTAAFLDLASLAAMLAAFAATAWIGVPVLGASACT
ncbi:hypothetical protein ACUN0C_12260 [Faunimonas sp. B44]|uniref:hypothetical protein n=1 Tax=Faunimonas sp. B44 TaxID=3461493 RepID=UPI0040439C8F